MEFGGYGQLCLKELNTKLHESALHFQSARAAFYSFLATAKPSALYLPNYICDSILPAVSALNIEIRWYEVSDNLLPKSIPALGENDLFVIVNYFGLLSGEIKSLINKCSDKVVIDNSQALFSKPVDCAATIYSPRKFLAIPDGGFLYSKLAVNLPTEKYDASQHLAHLFLRAAGKTQEGYSHYTKSEQSLSDYTPKLQSDISGYLISCADLEKVKRLRRHNYAVLKEEFGEINLCDFCLSDSDVPLCFPLKLDFDVTPLLAKLVSKNIFLPRYWLSEYNGLIGSEFYRNTLFLPIDERIDGDNHIGVMSDCVWECINARQ